MLSDLGYIWWRTRFLIFLIKTLSLFVRKFRVSFLSFVQFLCHVCELYVCLQLIRFLQQNSQYIFYAVHDEQDGFSKPTFVSPSLAVRSPPEFNAQWWFDHLCKPFLGCTFRPLWLSIIRPGRIVFFLSFLLSSIMTAWSGIMFNYCILKHLPENLCTHPSSTSFGMVISRGQATPGGLLISPSGA